jgi:hypothetical protein
MARRQVAARTEGDIYQGMFFWLQAAPLLREASRVQRVILEHDQAAGVDDVAVFYDPPGIDGGGRACAADLFQVKYHVDRTVAYSATNFCDPDLIRAKRSLLQHFHHAHEQMRQQYGWYRLYLVSNWQWAAPDPLASLLRESTSGSLPDRFFSDASQSALGKIRESWREHLALDETAFEEFARRLCLGIDFFGRRELRSWLSDRLARHGLRGIPEDRAQNPYDSLVQQFILNGTNDFDRKSFREMCEREGLLEPSPRNNPRVLAVRSFMRFAERIEDESDGFVCVAKYFDGRHIKSPELWADEVGPAVRRFLNDPLLRRSEHHLLLDCHSSLAFLAGYEVDRKSGAQIFPVQKGTTTAVWQPKGSSEPAGLTVSRHDFSTEADDTALAVSVTRDVLFDVQAHLRDASIKVRALLDLRPSGGTGANSVTGPDHAVAISDRIAEIVRAERKDRNALVHLFVAAPNAVMFFLGQHRGALGNVQLYEYDFEGSNGGGYSPSIRLPHN